MSLERPSIGEIKRWHTRAGGTFFEPNQMHYRGDTLRSFRVVLRPGGVILIERVRAMNSLDGNMLGGVGQRWRYDPETDDITPIAPVKPRSG